MSTSRALAGDSTLRRFLHMYFVAHEIMSQTATNDDLIDQTSEWLEDDNLEEICTLMGCSRSLMTLIQQTTTLASKVSQLRRTRELTESEVEEFSASRDSTEHLLHVLQQLVPPSVFNPDELLKIAETKRLSAILYLRDRLEIVSSSQPFTPTTYKSDLVSAIVSLISSLPNLSTLIWPLFVLGNTELNEENRRFVFERLTNIQRVRNLGSVRQAIIMVEHVWKKSDLSTDAWRSWGELGPSRQTTKMISLA
jgi:predicted house-cleaning noncanonical NTP pyrophosphatase (MazG superfamily)